MLCVSYFLHLLNWSATTTMMEITIGMSSLSGGILCTSWERKIIGIVDGFIACWQYMQQDEREVH